MLQFPFSFSMFVKCYDMSLGLGQTMFRHYVYEYDFVTYVWKYIKPIVEWFALWGKDSVGTFICRTASYRLQEFQSSPSTGNWGIKKLGNMVWVKGETHLLLVFTWSFRSSELKWCHLSTIFRQLKKLYFAI